MAYQYRFRVFAVRKWIFAVVVTGLVMVGAVYIQSDFFDGEAVDEPENDVEGEEEPFEEFAEAEDETSIDEGAEDAPLAGTIEIGEFGVTPAPGRRGYW